VLIHADGWQGADARVRTDVLETCSTQHGTLRIQRGANAKRMQVQTAYHVQGGIGANLLGGPPPMGHAELGIVDDPSN